MQCFKPLSAWLGYDRNSETGKTQYVFNQAKADFSRGDTETKFPCYSKCLGCKLTRSDNWAVKSHCELQMHDRNIMINPTYDDAHLPVGRTLDPDHMKNFMKRLYTNLHRQDGTKIRYLYCGEYGTKNNRPHYHCIIFGWKPDDAEHHHYSKNNKKYSMQQSSFLDDLWGHGECFVNEANFSTARYLVKYCTKVSYGTEGEEKYRNKVRPYLRQSRKPALGIPWLEKYWRDVYPSDGVSIDGREHMPPRAFDDWLEIKDPEMHRLVKKRRKRAGWKHMKDHPEEYEPLRLEQKEFYHAYTGEQANPRS